MTKPSDGGGLLFTLDIINDYKTRRRFWWFHTIGETLRSSSAVRSKLLPPPPPTSLNMLRSSSLRSSHLAIFLLFLFRYLRNTLASRPAGLERPRGRMPEGPSLNGRGGSWIYLNDAALQSSWLPSSGRWDITKFIDISSVHPQYLAINRGTMLKQHNITYHLEKAGLEPEYTIRKIVVLPIKLFPLYPLRPRTEPNRGVPWRIKLP